MYDDFNFNSPQSEWLPPQPPTVQPPAPDVAKRGGWRPFPILAASVLSAVVASGVTTQIMDDDPVNPQVAEQQVEPSVTVAEPLDVSAPSDELIANAAARVAPAVVQIQTRTGVGSGVIYDSSGLILSVAHVVEDQKFVEVRLADGSTVEGEVLGTHIETDMTVVQIPTEKVNAVAELAVGEELRIGQLAVAVGSPFGLDQTVTSGIVSSTNRIVNNVTMVQTDAAINPGNSGGPLVDAKGRVVGLNDVIFSKSGGNQGIGFAVHVDVAKIVADQIVEGKNVKLAFLGVSTTESPDGAFGAQVAEVSPNSAAATAGLQVGDLITGVDGNPIADSSKLRAYILRHAPGSVVKLEVERDSTTLTVNTTLGATN